MPLIRSPQAVIAMVKKPHKPAKPPHKPANPHGYAIEWLT